MAQGIGFKVGGMVLTKKLLFILFVELLAGLAFIVPIVMSQSHLGDAAEADESGTDVEGSCILSDGLTNATKGVSEGILFAGGANCTSFGNLTLDSILASQ
jgi:hypothetical protein